VAEEITVKELTVMIFLAGDNTLSPSMISQLKAIKDAGFQEHTNVVVRFDPNEIGAQTRIFEVNRRRKNASANKTMIGDGENPFVRNLRGDSLTLQELKETKGTGAELFVKEATKIDITKADIALEAFLDLCLKKYPAKHYMLFLVGHGMIVGNDVFLPDERPDSGISLQRLGKILEKFAQDKAKDSALELVGMHSCSLSAIEVAYQLKGTANYMMATEGISFVGGWPYRQLLKKIFKTIKEAPDNQLDKLAIQQLVRKLYFLCLHNTKDFMFAGFSHDLCLCNLNPTKVTELNAPLSNLTRALREALKVRCGKELILLAHWKAQSFWLENYSDLFDLCLCLSETCEDKFNFCRCGNRECDKDGRHQQAIKTACDGVIAKLKPQDPHENLESAERISDAFDNHLVIFSDHFGPTYQYAHGLSIYFPWSRPIEDGVVKVIENYKDYAFTSALGKDSWLNFLEEYFTETQRPSREVEDGKIAKQPEEISNTENALAFPENISTDGINVIGSLTGKTTPTESGGSACTCPSIKNYSRRFSVSEGAKRPYDAIRNGN
jgi:Clostripain family